MAEHTATIAWTRGSDENFLDKRYHRAHTWQFDGGATVAASSSPHVVPLPYSDAAAVDPLGRMLCSAETFRSLTRMAMQAADRLCGGRLALVHEGGYSEVYVPFCGHAVLEELSGSDINAPDPLAATLEKRQPDARFDAFLRGWIDAAAGQLGL